jgi:tetratricopeptide (TPR) repeat protein
VTRPGAALAVLAAVVAAAVFAPSLDGGRVWDDRVLLDDQLPHFRSTADCFVIPAGVPGLAPGYYRPLVLVSYRVDAALAERVLPGLGEGRERVMHATSVALHAIVSALVVLLALAVLPPATPGAAWLAGAAGLLFAVHPVHVETAAWIVGRSDSLAALFGLLALTLHLAYRRGGSRGALGAAALALFGALLSKAAAAGLVLLLPLADWILGLPATAGAASSPAPPPSARGKPRNEPPPPPAGFGAWLRAAALPAWLVYAAAVAAWFALRVIGIAAVPAGDSNPLMLRLDTLFGPLGWYVVKTFWPVPTSTYVRYLPDGPWIAAGIAGAIAFGAAWWWFGRKGWRPERFALALWLAPLLPALAIPALLRVPTNPVAERYLYLPSAGAVMLAAFLLGRALARPARVFAAAALLAPLAGFAAVAGQATFRDEASFWRAANRTSPDAVEPLVFLARLELEAGRLDAAQALIDRALALPAPPTNRSATLVEAGLIRLKRDGAAASIGLFREAAKANPDSATAHYNVALAALTMTKDAPDAAARAALFDEGIARLGRVLELEPDNTAARFRLGRALVAAGRVDEGVAMLETFVREVPNAREVPDARALLERVRAAQAGETPPVVTPPAR